MDITEVMVLEKLEWDRGRTLGELRREFLPGEGLFYDLKRMFSVPKKEIGAYLERLVSENYVKKERDGSGKVLYFRKERCE